VSLGIEWNAAILRILRMTTGNGDLVFLSDISTLSPAATPSYKASHDDRTDQNKWKGRYSDWRVLSREIAAYHVLCDEDNPNYSHKQIDKLSSAFREKRENMLAADAYET
jgi:hypothetical protein